MSPLGRRRGPALRAESGGGRREVRPRQLAVSDSAKTYLAEVIRSLGYDPWRAYANPPTPLRTIYPRPLKVSKTLESEAIFQHKSHAMLAYVEDCLQVAAKMAQDANLTPQRAPRRPPRAPKRPPRCPQRLPRGPKMPPRLPQHAQDGLNFVRQMSILCGRG